MEDKEIEALKLRRRTLEEQRLNLINSMGFISGQISLIDEAISKKTFITPEHQKEPEEKK